MRESLVYQTATLKLFCSDHFVARAMLWELWFFFPMELGSERERVSMIWRYFWEQTESEGMEWSSLLHLVVVCPCKLWYVLWVLEQRISREHSWRSMEDWNIPQLPLPKWLVPQESLPLQRCDWSDPESNHKDQGHIIIWGKNLHLSLVPHNWSWLNFRKHLQHE